MTTSEVSYPWNPTGEELRSCVREAREDVLYERCISNEDLSKELQSIVAESETNYSSGKFIEEEEMDNYLNELITREQ